MIIGTSGSKAIDTDLHEVRALIDASIRKTSLKSLAEQFAPYITSGKMLRARLVLGVGPASRVSPVVLHRTAAAVEMLHAASLLHDDVLDGGTERRGVPALWVDEGVKAAVVMGDLLVSQASGHIFDILPEAMPVLIETMQEMCDAEVEQEFRPFPDDRSWDRCVSIARRKTGSLFALAACCAGGTHSEVAAALRRAGYALGTAYQLADDLLDSSGDTALAGKTLGTDAQADKLTAVTARRAPGEDPLVSIEEFLSEADRHVSPWPVVREAWTRYTEDVVGPVIASFSTRPAPQAAS